MHFLRVRFELKDADDGLKAKVLHVLKHRVQSRKLRRVAHEAQAAQAKCFAALQLTAQQAGARAELAHEHFETRQKRIVIFNLKKNHLRKLMVRTVEVAREERERVAFFQQWRQAFRSRAKHWDSARQSTVQRDSMGQSPADLGFEADPPPFVGFNEETEEDLKKIMRSTLDSKVTASPAMGDGGSDCLVEMPQHLDLMDDPAKDLASSSGRDSLELLAGDVKLQSPAHKAPENSDLLKSSDSADNSQL